MMLAIQASAEDYEWQILDRVKETPDAFTYIFSPVTTFQRFRFSIGQFVTISALLKRPTEIFPVYLSSYPLNQTLSQLY